jgi:hypothetical protein
MRSIPLDARIVPHAGPHDLREKYTPFVTSRLSLLIQKAYLDDTSRVSRLTAQGKCIDASLDLRNWVRRHIAHACVAACTGVASNNPREETHLIDLAECGGSECVGLVASGMHETCCVVVCRVARAGSVGGDLVRHATPQGIPGTALYRHGRRPDTVRSWKKRRSSAT